MMQHQEPQELEITLQKEVTVPGDTSLKASVIAMVQDMIACDNHECGFISLACKWRDFLKARPSGIAQIAVLSQFQDCRKRGVRHRVTTATHRIFLKLNNTCVHYYYLLN